MTLQRQLIFRGVDSDKNLNVCFDENAGYSCIHARHLTDNFTPLIKLAKPYALKLSGVATKATHVVLLQFILNDLRMSDEFMVLPDLCEDVLIGAYTMQKWKIKLDFENDEIITNPKAARLILK